MRRIYCILFVSLCLLLAGCGGTEDEEIVENEESTAETEEVKEEADSTEEPQQQETPTDVTPGEEQEDEGSGEPVEDERDQNEGSNESTEEARDQNEGTAQSEELEFFIGEWEQVFWEEDETQDDENYGKISFQPSTIVVEKAGTSVSGSYELISETDATFYSDSGCELKLDVQERGTMEVTEVEKCTELAESPEGMYVNVSIGRGTGRE